MFFRLINPIMLVGLMLLGIETSVLADGFGPLPISLKGTPLPAVPGLLDGPDPIVVDKDSAIALGKALFWDTNVGSDGMACASCHYHAGADGRTKNQLAPGGKFSTLATAQTFTHTASNGVGGPNASLKQADFPFYQLADPLDPGSTINFQSDDVFGSSGTFAGKFLSVTPRDFSLSVQTGSNDTCNRAADPVFHVGASGTRKVTPRNAPTVINAVFNFRNFWDGRANNIFNGSSPWGDRDPNAGIWVRTGATTIAKQRLTLINSSLASLAVSPPLNDSEMSCSQRTFKDLARKILNRAPLEQQIVHYQDSVLGALSLSSPGNLQPGLNTYYRALVMDAFNSKYWSYPLRDKFGAPATPGAMPYAQIEANFSMFFGLAIQLYESTLVSDDSPFDRSGRNAQGLPTDLSATELSGLDQFRNSNCAMCHIGPAFTSAAIAINAQLVKTHPEAFGSPDIIIKTSNNVVTRSLSNAGNTLIDTGFGSTGVTPIEADIGLAGVDDLGLPLSFSQQYLQYLAGNNAAVYDAVVKTIRPCDFQVALALNVPTAIPRFFTQADGVIPQAQSTIDCATPSYAYQPTAAATKTELAKTNSGKTLAVVSGVLKIPSLRNIELTGPYMHNGSMSTLDQVLEFYARGGNFETPAKNFGFIFEQADLATNAGNRAAIVAFLKTLTDERVRYEKAPFDHPQINITHGHPGDDIAVSKTNPLSAALGADQYLVIDAVGANGRATAVKAFDQTLPH